MLIIKEFCMGKMNNNWTPLHSKVLNSIFFALNSHKIDWLIIRNYNGLPDHNYSKDIDIAIKRKNWMQAEKIVLQIFRSNGFDYYDVKQYTYICCYTFFNKDGYSFKLDFFDCNEYRGLITHDFDLLNVHKIQTWKMVYGSSDLHNSLIVFIRPLLASGKVKEKYIPEILNYYRQCPALFEEELSRLLGHDLTKLISGYLNEDHIKDICALTKPIKRQVLKYNLKSYGLKTYIRIAKHYIDTFLIRFKTVFHGQFIAVLGADGTGKSTFINKLTKQITFYYSVDLSKSHIYHHRPTILPNLGVVGEKSGIMKADTDFTNPHRAKPTGFFSSLIRMSYYWLDYLVGVPLMRCKDVRLDKLTIYDRYIYDFLIDPRRTRINLPYWIRNLFVKTVMQPHVVFVLVADAQTIYSRKQELTLEEINRQLKELKKLSKTHKRFVVINANQSPEKMADNAMKVILDRFTTKIL